MKAAFNKKKLLKLIDSKKVISFDIFDTLIKRNCKKPIDIFKIVENRYNNQYQNKIKDFPAKRILAESEVRKKNNTEDINLDEIYEMLDYKKDIQEKLKKLEIETELDYCQKNHSIYEIYKYCLEKDKKVICISDMYLSKNVIKKILEKNGYNIDAIFVSSDLRKTKLTGNIFDYAIKKLEISKKDLLHIGDSYKADLLAPLKKKILAFHINKYTFNTLFLNPDKKENNDITSNIMLSIINNNTIKTNDYYEKIGYEILGPLCCSLSYWINDTAKKNNIKNLLFCARDMKMVQEIYNNLFENDSIKNSYFYVSRKSTYLPYLYINKDYEKFKELIPTGSRKISISELLSLYNIDISKCENKLEKYNLNQKTKYSLDELRSSDDFKSYYQECISKIVNKEGKEQYNNFMKYLETLSVDKNTAIVDLGWRGTTQKIMIDIVKHNINGLYFGLHSKNEKYLKNNYWTYLFDGKENEFSNKIYSFMTIVEMLFSALHGSTIAYNFSNKEPYILSKSANENNEYIIKIQTGALNFCKDMLIYKDDLSYNKDDIFVNELIRIGTAPTTKQATILGDLYTENLKIRLLAKPKKISHYLLHPKELKNDFLDCEWKIGFMKRLFKIQLPYYRIYSYLKKKQ